MPDQEQHSLSTLDKLFPLLVIAAMAIGLLLGKAVPQVGAALEPLIPIGLLLMIYPTVTKVPFDQLRRSTAEGVPAGLSIVLNYVVNPLLLYGFGWLFLRQYPDMWTGMILLGIAPCIGMVLVWADLGRADNALSVGLMAWNSVIQIVSVPVWLYLLIGMRAQMPIGLVLQSTFLYLGLPLILAGLTRSIVMRRWGQQWFTERLTPVLNKVQLSALLVTLIVMFMLKGEVILAQPQLIAYMALPLALFFFTLFFMGTFAGRLFRLPIEKAVTVGFHVTGRNFELSIALALSLFTAAPMIAVSTVVGPLIEVPVMLTLAWISARIIVKAVQHRHIGIVSSEEPGRSI